MKNKSFNWFLFLICQTWEITVKRISNIRLDPIDKHPGHMTLQWQSTNVITVDSALQRDVNNV